MIQSFARLSIARYAIDTIVHAVAAGIFVAANRPWLGLLFAVLCGAHAVIMFIAAGRVLRSVS